MCTFLESLIFDGCNPVVKALSAYGWILQESGPYPTYVLGIVTDRAADALFDKFWKPSLVQQVYQQDGDDYDDRRYIYLRSERLANLLEYGRSRLRICRGWMLNTLLILFSLNIFIQRQLAASSIKSTVFLFSNIFLVIFAWCLWFSWKQLTLADYRKVKRQSAWLRTQK